MSASPKITPDMVKSYSGQGDLVAWLTKAKLVAKLANIEDLASFIPLYLEGEALSIFLEMSDSDQQSAQKIEGRLKEAFTDGPFISYAKLVNLKWNGESVDVYATEIRRLVGLSGISGTDANALIKLAFVHGFPESIRVELQQVDNIADMSVADLLPRARILVANQSVGVGAVAESTASKGEPVKRNDSGSYNQAKGGFKGKCFNCEGAHMVRNCPKPRKTDRRYGACFNCGKEGHFANQCDSGN